MAPKLISGESTSPAFHVMPFPAAQVRRAELHQLFGTFEVVWPLD
jgi:hypothetical protein